MKTIRSIVLFIGITMSPVLLLAQNNALVFDGSNDYAIISSFASLTNDLTVEFWFKADLWTNTNFPGLVSRRTSYAAMDWELLYNQSNNRIEFYYGNSGANQVFEQLNVNPTTGIWHHLAFTFNNATDVFTLYLDGASMGTEYISGASLSSDNPLYIASLDNINDRFDGAMDELRIWNDVRTISEIRQNMYRELPDPAGETNLVAYYKFNETSGTSLTDLKASYNATLTNMAGSEWTTSAAIFGPKYAVDFNGTNDYVSIKGLGVSTTSGDKTTVEFWMYWDGTTNVMPFGWSNYDLWFSGSYFGFNSDNNDIYGVSSSGLAGKWVHVAAIFNNGDITQSVLYLNGIQQSLSQALGTPLSRTVSSSACIGTYVAANQYFFDGKIDELRIWNGARSEGEIRENMCKMMSGNESGLLAYYTFNSQSGDKLIDFSGNTKDGHFVFTTGTLDAIETQSYVTDLSKSWVNDELIGKKVIITTPGKEQERTITDNFSNGFLVSANFNPSVIVGDTYIILDNLIVWTGSEAFNTWLNTNSNGWASGSNWSRGTAPSVNDNVGVYGYSGGSQVNIFPLNAINNLMISSTATPTVSSALTVNGNIINRGNVTNNSSITSQRLINNGSVIIGTSSDLTINSELTINTGATLTLESDGNGTGSLIVSGSLTNNGTINIQRYIEGWSDANHGWHFLSSPVTVQPISDFHTPGSGNDFYKWDEPTNMWVNRTASGGGLNGDFESNFVTGKGYLLANASASTPVFSGTPNLSAVNITGLSKTEASSYSGWHLIGNPFPSAIQWGLGNWNLNNVDNNCQIWNEANASYTVVSSGNNIIPAMNGFMVHASVNNASLTIPTEARVHNSTNWYKQTKMSDGMIVLKAVDPEGQTMQETIIAFDEQASDGYDTQYDSYFLAGYAPLFYSIAQGASYALNTLPELNEELVVSMGFVKNGGTDFTIELSQSIEGFNVYLFDKKHSYLHKFNDGSYNFSADEGDLTERFELRFGVVGINDMAVPDTYLIWMHGSKLMVDGAKSGDILVMYDLQGRIITTNALHHGSNMITLRLQSGVYLARVANKTIKVFIP